MIMAEFFGKSFWKNGRIQTLFLWILKSFDSEILTISSDSSSKMSQIPKKLGHVTGEFSRKMDFTKMKL